MARLFKPALGILGIALFLAEFLVLSLSVLRPQVSEAYYDYYIGRTRSCFLTPAAARQAVRNLQGGEITVARLDPATACYLLKAGWANIETWGVWSLGKQASIELPMAPGQVAVQLTLKGFSKHGLQGVKIYLGDQYAGAIAVPNGNATNYRLAVPPGAGGSIIISLRIATPTTPASVMKSDDTRPIGIGLVGIARL